MVRKADFTQLLLYLQDTPLSALYQPTIDAIGTDTRWHHGIAYIHVIRYSLRILHPPSFEKVAQYSTG